MLDPKGEYTVYPPQPGSPGGPCAGQCHHIKCNQMRRAAAELCQHCKEPVGYDNLEWLGPAGGYASWPDHATCHDAALQQQALKEAAAEAAKQHPPVEQPHPWPHAGSDWRYTLGKPARCRHCARYPGRACIYDDWVPDEKPGVWRSPRCGHRIHDMLMQIVRDDVEQPQGA